MATAHEGLRRLQEDTRAVDRLAALGEQGMANGVADDLDIDAFVEDVRTSA